jgi:hypothetical protein
MITFRTPTTDRLLLEKSVKDQVIKLGMGPLPLHPFPTFVGQKSAGKTTVALALIGDLFPPATLIKYNSAIQDWKITDEIDWLNHLNRSQFDSVSHCYPVWIFANEADFRSVRLLTNSVWWGRLNNRKTSDLSVDNAIDTLREGFRWTGEKIVILFDRIDLASPKFHREVAANHLNARLHKFYYSVRSGKDTSPANRQIWRDGKPFWHMDRDAQIKMLAAEPSVTWIFTAEDYSMIAPELRSLCQRIDIPIPTDEEISILVDRYFFDMNRVIFPSQSLEAELIAKHSKGNLRTALKLASRLLDRMKN